MQFNDALDIVICPGCGENVPHDNDGCPHCGYENGFGFDISPLMTLRELIAAPSYPEQGALVLNDVCPAFLRRVVEVAAAASKRMEGGS